MNLVITIDTEEDNWAHRSAVDNSLRNIQKLIPLQKLFDQYDVKPTYLITYPVANDVQSVEILKGFLDAGKCEIGMHCHPWNTPPLDEKAEIKKQDTMLCNLSDEVVFDKLSVLYDKIVENFNVAPVSFRAGRWGFGPSVARALCKLNIRVDTSVSPYVDWSQNFGPDFSGFSPHLFRFEADGLEYKSTNGPLLEVPVTVGFLQKNFKLCQQLTKAVENPLGRRLRLKGVMNRLNLVSRHWLSPEQADAATMIKLADRMEKNGYPYINMTFHSNSLLAGCSPFVKKMENEQTFFKKIELFLEDSKIKGRKSITLSEIEPKI